ncbi:hypothetical protein PMAYCL1PPCAC_28782 [Pristionchus mayeri]|uniref:Bestrophin homolog n=1 Tax=Pristionchus mayeri TaxID=1317129 RepID=A0AAN5IAA9_9BILA|nr:hypothetical protein PMAYCL1PPCAC_28782 [Pristionchus mayeri]
MTLNYHKEIMTSHPWTFFKLLWNWRASVWKAVIVELICWLIVYGIISVIYRCALAEWQMEIFENIVRYCQKRLGYIPLDLLLGFYVSMNVDRWTYRYRRIGFIDNPCLMTAEYVRGHSDVGRMFRRTIIRYAVLGQIMVFRDISLRTRRRFPTLDSIVKAGFMTEVEKKEFESYKIKCKQWICFNWAYSLVYEARKKGLIKSDLYVHQVIDDLRTFRTDLQSCNNYDWTPIPLLYNHVVCLAVHFYFLVCLIARQFIVHEGAFNPTPIDIYFPVMPMLQLFFYMSWLKIAEVMMNPYGEDDDDWETNALIDRNIHMGMAIVDAGFDRPPELRKDIFWDDEVVDPLYAENSQHDNGDGERGMRGSASMANLDSHSSLRHLLHLRHRKNSKLNIVIAPTSATSRIPDRPIVPNRASILSLEGLKNIKKKVQKTAHYSFYPNGEGVAGLKAEKGELKKKKKSMQNGQPPNVIHPEPLEFTVIEIDDYRIPSAPIEVSPPPTYAEEDPQGKIKEI